MEECYKNLIESGKVDEANKAKASRFNIIPVFAPKADHLKLLLLSRALNQDMAGPQKEATVKRKSYVKPKFSFHFN